MNVYGVMTIEEFRAQVHILAAGRAYTVSCVTTETQQSDGSGTRTLSWQAWIEDYRSGINGCAYELLRWLGDGNMQGIELAISPGMASVTIGGWAAQTPPADEEPPL